MVDKAQFLGLSQGKTKTPKKWTTPQKEEKEENEQEGEEQPEETRKKQNRKRTAPNYVCSQAPCSIFLRIVWSSRSCSCFNCP